MVDESFEDALEPFRSEDTLSQMLQMFLSHFGAFAIGGAIGVGVYAEAVSNEFCSRSIFASFATEESCRYLGGLATEMQLGLAGLALVTLVTSELISRARHRDA